MFKPAIDNRYHDEKVVSHDGNELEAINITTARDILLQDLSHVDVIGIDEIQFFDKEIVNIVEKLAEDGHRVVVLWIGHGLSWRTIRTYATNHGSQ